MCRAGVPRYAAGSARHWRRLRWGSATGESATGGTGDSFDRSAAVLKPDCLHPGGPPSGERTILWKRDARLDLLPGELRPEWIRRARLLHVDGHPSAPAALAAQWAREAGVMVTADLDNLYPEVEALLEHVDFLISSRISHKADRNRGSDRVIAGDRQTVRMPRCRHNLQAAGRSRLGRRAVSLQPSVPRGCCGHNLCAGYLPRWVCLLHARRTVISGYAGVQLCCGGPELHVLRRAGLHTSYARDRDIDARGQPSPSGLRSSRFSPSVRTSRTEWPEAR